MRTRKSLLSPWVELAGSVEYEPFGPVKSFVYGNGLSQSNSYDLHYRPDTLQALDGATPLQGLKYGYNQNDELDSITNLIEAARNQSFLYDANNRLDLASGAYGSLDFNYDGVGNRTDLAADSFDETYTYPPDSHRLESVSATGSGGQNRVFDYSATGNITGNGTFTFGYNPRNRLISVKQGATNIADYGLNALGQRVSKTANGATRYFHYGLDNKLLTEFSDINVTSRNYIYLNDQLISIVDDEYTGAAQ